MGIVFFCQSCGARFEVDPRMAGKKGHCKKCGQIMSIPRAEQIASMAAMPALAAAAVGAGVDPRAGVGASAVGTSLGSWLKAGISQAVLAPLSVDRMSIAKKKPSRPSPLDDAQDSKPYVLAQPEVRASFGGSSALDNIVVRAWRQQLGGLQKLFRKINQTAYLVSIPFIMILLLGIVVKNRPMALFGATLVVLLNIGRLVAGGVNLALVPFRDGINFKKMKKPIQRVVEPVVTIGLVILAFYFIPWLSSAKSTKGSIADRVRSEVETLETDMKGEVGKIADKAKALDLEKLGTQAQDKLKDLSEKAKALDLQKLGEQAQDKLKGLGLTSGSGPPREGSTGGIRSGLKALEKRTSEELEKAKALNEPRP
jgi:hypothetical protein